MIVCVKCKKIMTCVKTGRILVWNGSHCYSGDEFECIVCKNKLVNISSTPFFVANALKKFKKEEPINMDKKEKKK